LIHFYFIFFPLNEVLTYLGMTTGQEFPTRVGGPPRIGENPLLDEGGDGDGDRDRDQSPSEDGYGVNFHLVPASPLRKISPSPFPIFHPWLGNNPHARFFIKL